MKSATTKMQTTANISNPRAADAAERKVAMTSIETEVREFAREFPTPNVQSAVALCESGRLSWTQVHEIFRQSLAKGLTEVAR